MNTQKRPHPFPPKLSMVIAEEIRRQRRHGVSVDELARRYGVAKASISAVLHLHAYVPEFVVPVRLDKHTRGVLTELADEQGIAAEQLAADILNEGLDRLTPE